MQHARERCWLVVDEEHEAARASIQLARQIVERSEHLPCGVRNALDRERDRWAGSKTLPSERHRGWLEHPVGTQPLDDVVVARDSDELSAVLAHPLLNGVRADLRDLSIDDARELVDEQRSIACALDHATSEIDAKALACREHVVRSQPCR